jgi:alkanesulfonate monooxygenase SsuD/methylene tetrahydromethanopterin reductase-like flavin-dependent oxidoreductase (luciferase family)
MDIGIGLPNTIPGTDGRTLVEWAAKAEAAGFSSLCTVGRVVYDSFDDLVSLAAAAAVTDRVRLTTGVLLAPTYANTALLAKQAASVDRISGGRLVLGVGLGGRDDDFTGSGLPTEKRGRRLNEQLAEMKRIWAGEERGFAGAIGPAPARPGGPELIVGGYTDAAFRRVARFGDGWIMGAGSGPAGYAQMAPTVEEAWRTAGRSGSPRMIAPAYFALGPNAREAAERELGRYYAFRADVAERLIASAAVGGDKVREYVEGYREAGADEAIFLACSSDLAEIERLAEVVF